MSRWWMRKAFLAKLSIKNLIRALMIQLLIVTVVLPAGIQVKADDELWLSGKVISYDSKTGRIEVDVKSESCRGKRTFVTSPGLPEEALKGKEIDFGIDSSVCEEGKVYKITNNIVE